MLLTLLSIWYLIGLITGLVALYIDWRGGIDIDVGLLGLVIATAVLGLALPFILFGDELGKIFGGLLDKTLIPGRRKP